MVIRTFGPPQSKANTTVCNSRAAFTYVEFLVVILLVSVLAAVAAPSYMKSRKDASGRGCLQNLRTIASAEAAYAKHYGIYKGASSFDTTTWAAQYTAGVSAGTPTGGLLGAPSALSSIPTCPLNGSSYEAQVDSSTGVLTLRCPDRDTHASDTGQAASNWILSAQPNNQDTNTTEL